MAGLQGRCRDTRVSRLLPDASGPRSFCLLSGAQHPFWQLRGTSPALPHPSRPRTSSLCWAAGAKHPLWAVFSSFGLWLSLQARSWAVLPCAPAAEGDPPHSGTCLPGPTLLLCRPSPAFAPVWRPGGPRTNLEEQVGALAPQGRQPRPCPGAGTPDRHPVPG